MIKKLLSVFNFIFGILYTVDCDNKISLYFYLKISYNL